MSMKFVIILDDYMYFFAIHTPKSPLVISVVKEIQKLFIKMLPKFFKMYPLEANNV